MKPHIYIFIFLLLIVFGTACTPKGTVSELLHQADKLLMQYPDSGRTQLQSYRETIQKENESTQMHYYLLLTKANEACGIQHTSDSLIKRVVRYYEKQGSNKQTAEAYYYQGCVYRDLDDVDYALEAFQLATYLPNAPAHQLVGKAYNQMGNLFTYQKLDFAAMEAYRESAYHALHDKDSITWSKRLKSTAHAFTALNQPDSALHYFELAIQANPQPLQKDIEKEKAELFIRMKDFSNARIALEHNPDDYLTWADYYHGVNKKDSASHYYEYALKHKRTNEWQRKAIYQRLSAYAEEQGQFQKAYFYLKMADRIQDTLYNQYEAERIRQAQLIQTYRNASKKKYQNAPDETEEKPSGTFPIGNLVTIGLLGIGAFVAFHYRRKKQIDNQLPETNDLHQSAIYQLIKSQAHKSDFKLTDEQWQELQIEIDRAYNHFTARLYAICPKLNKTELHVCYLLKLKVSPTDIANIIMRQVSTISSTRKRLYEKIHGVEGNAKQLDDFISKF